jgi:fatty-acid desaturase
MIIANATWVSWAVRALQCILFLAWIVCAALALVGLRKYKLSDTARVLWALMIVAVPILGAVAFWIVRPQNEDAVG